MSDGETPQEAVENVMDAIACWIEAAEEDGRPVSTTRRCGCGIAMPGKRA
jgi:predicted RNase H-like HicB family nuclease